jgi:hypothetical protein
MQIEYVSTLNIWYNLYLKIISYLPLMLMPRKGWRCGKDVDWVLKLTPLNIILIVSIRIKLL